MKSLTRCPVCTAGEEDELHCEFTFKSAYEHVCISSLAPATDVVTTAPPQGARHEATQPVETDLIYTANVWGPIQFDSGVGTPVEMVYRDSQIIMEGLPMYGVFTKMIRRIHLQSQFSLHVHLSKHEADLFMSGSRLMFVASLSEV